MSQSQIQVQPDAIMQAQQETINRQQQELVMLRAAIIQLTSQQSDSDGYREGDDPVSDG